MSEGSSLRGVGCGCERGCRRGGRGPPRGLGPRGGSVDSHANSTRNLGDDVKPRHVECIYNDIKAHIIATALYVLGLGRVIK